MKTFKVSYRTWDNKIKTIIVQYDDSTCAQLQVIMKTHCDGIVRVVEIKGE